MTTIIEKNKKSLANIKSLYKKHNGSVSKEDKKLIEFSVKKVRKDFGKTLKELAKE